MLVLWNDLGAHRLSYHQWVRGLLRSVWREPRPPEIPPLRWWDWALTGAVAAVAVLEALLRPGLAGRAVWAAVAVALAPTLLLRRTRPLLAVAIAFPACLLAGLLPHVDPNGPDVMAFVLLLVYSLFRWGSGGAAVLGAGVVLAKIGASVLLGQLGTGDALAGLVVLSAVVALGVALRYRARARLRELDQAKLLERERLARDLHDTVAHHVSAMAIRAQAGLATVDTNPEAAREALRVIEAEASRALTEMRAMVRLLRDGEPAQLAPSPRIDDLTRLATAPRAGGADGQPGGDPAGPVVDVAISGEVGGVAAPVQAAVYRLAQESVTNARRHARHATRIEVRVAVDRTAVSLRVSDDGEPGPVRPARADGYGLRGMIERAGLLGGVCEAGPAPGRGWTVTAVLPLGGAAPVPGGTALPFGGNASPHADRNLPHGGAALPLGDAA